MVRPYALEDYDTSNPYAVAFALIQLAQEAYPGSDTSYIGRLVSDVRNLFDGKLYGLRPIDTLYHDIEHTLQATLCFTRLMVNRHLAGVEPHMSEHDFKIGLVSILLHDSGYIKKRDDNDGTGAKYTSIHEQRSCEFATRYLNEFGWPAEDILSVQHMISCTGPFADIDAVPFRTGIHAIIGRAVATADYIGQMSDAHYVYKLPHLFREFEESDSFRGIPEEKRIFRTFETLFRKTPDFWEKIVLPKLSIECQNLYRFLSVEFPDGPNPYIQCIEKNLALVRQMLAENRLPEPYQRPVLAAAS